MNDEEITVPEPEVKSKDEVKSFEVTELDSSVKVVIDEAVAKPIDDNEPAEEMHAVESEHTKHKPDAKHHERPIIIIKRVKKVHNKHHGGAWKIAYADFVTAMMTFFLLLWLLSMLNKYQLQGISEYFQRPIKTVITQQPDPKKEIINTKENQTTDKKPNVNQNNAASDKSIPKEKQEKAASEKIKADLEKQLQENPIISQYKNMLNFTVTSQGLKIELKDLENKPMFSSGKTDFAEYASTILDWLALAMNKYPNRVMILGHTDSKPIQGDNNYTNWELSADRANATRRELVNNGMMPEKIVRIVGVADVDKLNATVKSDDPANRRIEIVILNDEAFNKMQNE